MPRSSPSTKLGVPACASRPHPRRSSRTSRACSEPEPRHVRDVLSSAEAHRPGKVTSVEVCMGGPGRDLHLRSLELAAEDRLDERLEAQEERLDLGHALFLEEIDPLVELDAHLPSDVPEMEAEARIADVPVAHEKLEGVAERRRAHGAEAQRPVGSGPEAGADGEGPSRRSDGVHVPVLTELLTEGDLLAERGDVRGVHAGAFQDRFAERPRGSELLEHELAVRRGHRQVVGGAPQTPGQRTTIHSRKDTLPSVLLSPDHHSLARPTLRDRPARGYWLEQRRTHRCKTPCGGHFWMTAPSSSKAF